MPTKHLDSFKIDEKECVDLPNLVDADYISDEETGRIEIINPPLVNARRDSVIQLKVKTEHRDRDLFKVLTIFNGDNNSPKILQWHHNYFENDFGANFESDGILVVDTSILPINEGYAVELQLFRNNPDDPEAAPLELMFYYLEVILGEGSEPPTVTIPTIETEQFIKINGKWFRMVDKIN